MPIAHPPIVQAAGRGDLAEVRRLLSEGVPVDSCTRWTDSEEKYGGYTKSWQNSADTPLCAALRGGHTDVALALLAAGASATISVSNGCDVYETPRGIARAVMATHPACAHAVLAPAFEEQRRAAEEAWAAVSPPTLVQLAARELLVDQALELLPQQPLRALYSTEELLTACVPPALAALPEPCRRLVAPLWRGAKDRAAAQDAAERECLALGTLYWRGEGVEADPAAAAHWLARGLSSRSEESFVRCWADHAEYSHIRQSGSCSNCKHFNAACDALRALEGSDTAGAAAAAALDATARRGAALLESPLHALECARRAAKARLRAAADEEHRRLTAEAREQQRLQDERFEREVRAPEVARCAQFEAQRNASLSFGGVCRSRHCDVQDYCTYYHDGRPDLPPHCRWFVTKQCRQGDRCWYNHLPRRPPAVPMPPYR